VGFAILFYHFFFQKVLGLFPKHLPQPKKKKKKKKGSNLTFFFFFFFFLSPFAKDLEQLMHSMSGLCSWGETGFCPTISQVPS
jgi:hypothetical protein